ncbi:uncharacterized protein LOC134239092 [Saccostrea cucullata]|uniref:uncharacterized protein LOC134239092 n=1 Tax=Saccostrea cuccullata TaxID=36930 RepID=UPI002ED3E130
MNYNSDVATVLYIITLVPFVLLVTCIMLACCWDRFGCKKKADSGQRPTINDRLYFVSNEVNGLSICDPPQSPATGYNSCYEDSPPPYNEVQALSEEDIPHTAFINPLTNQEWVSASSSVHWV